MNIEAHDCSPLPLQPTEAEAAWLRGLAARFHPGPYVVAIGDRREDEPVVYCERDGTWWAGRYVGVIRHEGGRLTVRPRFGMATLASWLGQSLDALLILAIESNGQIVAGSSGISGDSYLVRFNNDGSADTTFGTSGVVTTSAIYDGAAMVTAANGETVMVGTPSSGSGIILQEFGTLARTFTYYVEFDADYNVVSISDASGNVLERYRYSNYGLQTVMNASGGVISISLYGNTRGFQGEEENDALGFVYAEARILDVYTGSWFTEDHAGYVNGANRGQYETSNPVSNLDPSGNQKFYQGWGSAISVLFGGYGGEAAGRCWAYGSTRSDETISQVVQVVPDVVSTVFAAADALATDGGDEELLDEQLTKDGEDLGAIGSRPSSSSASSSPPVETPTPTPSAPTPPTPTPTVPTPAAQNATTVAPTVPSTPPASVATGRGGPYGHLDDHPSVGSGKAFTQTQKANILEANEARNGGILRDDVTGDVLVRSEQSDTAFERCADRPRLSKV
jgi:RHS repeat-associated protein